MIKPRVKICCISSVEEAALAIKYGASALGLVSEMPSGPGVIALEQIAEIAERVPPPIGTFLLTCKQTAREIAAQYDVCRTNTIQICDQFTDSYDDLRKALPPPVKLVQVIHVGGEESLREAIEVSEKVDGILLDSGNQKLEIKELGGTGRTHDWEISRKIVEAVKKPVFLAGGLKAENVREAIEKVQPFGLDLCSSVRTDGKLDEEKLRRFFAEIEKGSDR
ncbi:MAG: phosphoribosylanthranilate isomerase [Acidobacteriota bacterium]|nr:phosphoribosylanthranilate isomerase [Acidobacteriota bacterium]